MLALLIVIAVVHLLSAVALLCVDTIICLRRQGQTTDEHGRAYWLCPGLESCGGSGEGGREDRALSNRLDGNLLSSLCVDGSHRPVIDLDVPVRYVPSTTEGHGHLYVDVPMDWERYSRLLVALEAAGLVEPGYVRASFAREQTFVRPPWVRKTR